MIRLQNVTKASDHISVNYLKTPLTTKEFLFMNQELYFSQIKQMQSIHSRRFVWPLIDTTSLDLSSEKLEPTFQQLEKFGLKSKPFVIIAVIGQELVAAGQFSTAVTLLEAALKVQTFFISRKAYKINLLWFGVQ